MKPANVTTKMSNIFDNVDGLVVYNMSNNIKFFYNDEPMILKNDSNYIFSVSFCDASLHKIKVNDIKQRHLLKRGIVFYIELLLKLRHTRAESLYLKVKSIIPEEIIQPLTFQDKIKSKFSFCLKPSSEKIHHSISIDTIYKLYLDEQKLKWNLSYEYAYLSRTIKTKMLVEKGIFNHLYELVQRNYEWECFPDFEEDY